MSSSVNPVKGTSSDASLRRRREARATAELESIQPGRSIERLEDGQISDEVREASGLTPEVFDSSLTLCDRLSNAFGLPLTRHNAVWGPFALDKLRELQRALLEHAMTLEAEPRRPVLDAVKTIELSVMLRLRYEEMTAACTAMLSQKTSPTATKSAPTPIQTRTHHEQLA